MKKYTLNPLLESPSELKNRSVKSAGIMIGSRAAGTIIQFFSAVILARLLSPQDFGLVAMVTVFSLLLYNVGLNGFVEAIIQARELRHDQISNLFWIGILISSSLAILFILFTPLLSLLYKEPRVIAIGRVMAIGFIFSALATEHQALMMRNMQFGKIFVSEFSATVFSTIMAIVLALNGAGYWAIVGRQLSIGIVAAIFSWIQCPWRPALPRRGVKIKSFIKFAASTFVNFSVNYFARNIDKAILGWKCGSIELGYYDRAYRIFVLPVSQLTDPLSSVALSTLSKIREEPLAYRNFYLKAISTVSLVGMYISALLTVSGKEIINILLGQKWSQAGIIFIAFGPSIGIILLYQTITWLYLSRGLPHVLLKWTISASSFMFILYLIGVKYRGIGMAIAYSISLYLLVIPGLHFAVKGTAIKLRDIINLILKYFISFAFSGLLTAILFKAFLSKSHYINNIFAIAIKSIIVTLLYALCSLLIFKRKKDIIEFIAILKIFFKKSFPNTTSH